MKTSTQRTDDETESEDDVDGEEFDTSESEEEPAGNTSGRDERDGIHTAHVCYGGACMNAMNDDETKSEEDVDDGEIDTSDSEGEPAGDTSGRDELNATHAAHVGRGGACENAMDDKEFLKWIDRKRSETTRKNSEEEHVLKVPVAKEN